MTPDEFLLLTSPLPEPMLLLTGDGLILAGNRAVEERLGVPLSTLRQRRLAEVVSEPPEEVARYLLHCSRSRSFVLGALRLVRSDGGEVTCRAEGAVIRPRSGDADAVLMMRLIPRASAQGQFVALNQRIDALGSEVQRRRRAEESLRQQEERLRVTLHSIGDAVITTDDTGAVWMMNPIAEQLTGWTQSDALGRPLVEVFNIVNETTRQTVENPALRSLQEGVIVGLANHTVLVARDGRECQIDNSAAPIRDDSNKIVGSVLVFRDVSALKRSQKALTESEGRFRQLADAQPQIVWTARADGTIDYMNLQWTEFTGLPATAGNAGWAQVVHPEDMAVARERWATSVRIGVPFEMELRLLEQHTHSYRWHLLRTVPAHDDAANVVRWFGTGTDIHQQKRAAESSRYLAEASATLAGVVDFESTLQKVASLAVPYFADWSAVDVANDDGTFRRLAVAHENSDKVALAHALTRDYPPDPDAPGGAFAVFRTGQSEIVAEISDEMLVQGTQDARHLELIRSLGLRSYICVPLVVSGEPIGVLTFATAESGRAYTDLDLALATELAQRAGVALENFRLYEALRDADRRKDEFLATLAHELRNPLAPIRNSLQILKMPQVDAETVEKSRLMMERQVHHLVRLVDDLLDVSRVMRGKIELRKERIEVATVVARAFETVQPLIDAQGHRLEVSLPSESLLVEVDPVRIAQVVGNLLTNAAKYSDSNRSIWLTAARVGGEAELRVRDTGIGIASNMLAHIFELFVQVDQASTRAQGGLGIGLTLVKNLVEMHHGRVEARSAGLGEGSEFIVRLPLAAQRSSDRPTEAGTDGALHLPTPPSVVRLLVVDDNEDAAVSLATLLRCQGHEVRVAHSGVSALELTTVYVPDVILLDIGMPGMDGYEVARRMRARPALQKVVLAALTGWGQQSDRRRTAAAGFDHHLVKPLEPTAIERLLAGLKR